MAIRDMNKVEKRPSAELCSKLENTNYSFSSRKTFIMGESNFQSAGRRLLGDTCLNEGRSIQRTHSVEHFQVPAWKRVLDVICILCVVPILVPLMMLISLLIKLSSPGPVFFKQQRIGYLGQRFMLLKFRTMVVNADIGAHQNHLDHLISSNAPMIKMDATGDSRLIRFGALLRSSGLDELPQLINVLRGEMSLVGPRPCLPYEHDKYLPRHKKRYETLPGLTGFWQVNGKNKTTFREMIAMDLWYAKNKSVAIDLWIMFRTVPALFAQIREMRSRNAKNQIIWFPKARRATAIIDSFLHNELRKSKAIGRNAIQKSQSLGGNVERKTLWQNR
jgi:exopolysaccharide production protein ExoY